MVSNKKDKPDLRQAIKRLSDALAKSDQEAIEEARPDVDAVLKELAGDTEAAEAELEQIQEEVASKNGDGDNKPTPSL